MAMKLNPLLLEALRSRPSAVADPALQTLLSGMDSGASGGALPSAQELLSQLESTNPTMGLIAKYLAARQASESETSTYEEIEAEEEVVRAVEEQRLAFEQSERLAQIVQHLEAQVKKLCTELDQLRDINDALAAALGACYLCWGKDASCPVCHGIGRPGSAMPDKQLFAQFVVPAIRTLQNQRVTNRNNSKNEQSDGSIQHLKAKKGEKNE